MVSHQALDVFGGSSSITPTHGAPQRGQVSRSAEDTCFDSQAQRRAETEEEARALYALLVTRSTWLWSKGIQQWNPVYPVARFNAEVQGGRVWYWGSKALTKIEQNAIRDGVQALRLDVAASNPFLEPYYLRHGFRRVAVGTIKGGASLFLEKPLRA